MLPVRLFIRRHPLSVRVERADNLVRRQQKGLNRETTKPARLLILNLAGLS